METALAQRTDTLRRIAQHEASLRQGLIARLLRLAGGTRLFSFAYRRVGPAIDPWLMRRFSGLMTRIYGMPGLIITTTGARSGLPRTSPLLYVRDGDDFLVVGTNFGQDHHPAWTGNLLAQPRARIEVGPGRLEVTGALLDEAEFARQWQKFVDVYSPYATYLTRTSRRPLMFRLRPAE